MINITLGKLKDIEGSLKKLFLIDFPVLVSYKLSKSLNKITNELSIFEKELNKLIQKYGDSVGEEKYKITNEIFYSEVEKLRSIEIQLDIDIIDINLLNDSKLSAVDIMNLSSFLNIGELK